MNVTLIKEKIHDIRGQRVMLDFDLAELYQVETRVLKQSVRRNIERFPGDFMFIITDDEADNLVSQFVIPSKSHLGGASPFAFTEQGVAMLSSVLRSEKAIQVNIAIMRAFIAIRQFAITYTELAQKIAALESKFEREFADVHEVLTWLGEENQARANEIGTLQNEDRVGGNGEDRQIIGFKNADPALFPNPKPLPDVDAQAHYEGCQGEGHRF